MAPLPNLNVLRFFLAMVVLLGHIAATSKNLGLPHFPYFPLLHKQNLAVYFFFCLSGFLIVRQLYLETQNNSLNVLHFYKRRLLRILPLYFLVLFTGILIYFVLLPLMGIQTGFHNNVPELLKYFVLGLPNVYISEHPRDVGGILFILWSIGIELQFYLFIPLLVIVFKRNLVTMLSGLIIIHILGSLWFPSIAGHYFNFYYFLAGGIISILSIRGKLMFMQSKWVGLVFLMLFCLLFLTDLIVIRNDIIYYVTTAFLAAFFICSIADFPTGKIENRTLNYFGEISYGIYMYHMICLTAILYLFTRLKLADTIASNAISVACISLPVIVFTILLAHLSYRYFESYFTKKKSTLKAASSPQKA